MTLIEARGLTKRFGDRTAVDNVDLEVRDGSCFGFLGPNGAGKTTLIRLLLGLAHADAGSVRIGGIDVAHDAHRALRRVGAIVEEPRFHGHLTGVENLQVHAALLDDPPAARARIPSLLQRVGLQGRGDDKVKGYSMGMRQRLGVARALLGEPDLLVLDEPTNGLDAEGMSEFRVLIRGLVEDEGRTVFLSSHLLDEMEKLCDEVAIVEQGRVVQQSTVSQFIAGGGLALVLDCDDPQRAEQVLAHPAIRITTMDGGRLRLDGVGERPQAIAIVKRLVDAGIGVAEIRRHALTLEQRYMEVTRESAAARQEDAT